MSKQIAYDADGNPIGTFDLSTAKITVRFKTKPFRFELQDDGITVKPVFGEPTIKPVGTYNRKTGEMHYHDEADRSAGEPSHAVSNDGVLFDEDTELPPRHPGIYQGN